MEAKCKSAEAKNLMMEQAREFWAIQGDVSKMTNKQLISILRPLHLKDESAIPTRKDQLLVCFAEWSNCVTMEMITPRMPLATLLPAEVNLPPNSVSSIESETPPNIIAYSPPSSSPTMTSPSLSTTFTSPPQTETPSTNISSPPLGTTRNNTTEDNAFCPEPPSHDNGTDANPIFHETMYDYGSDEDESNFWNNESMMLLQMGLNNMNLPESEGDEAIEAMMALAGDPQAV